MKILDEKGKLFGKISIIDIAVILVIVLAIAGGALVYAKISSNDIAPGASLITSSAEKPLMEAKLLIKNVRNVTKDAISVGDELYTGTKDSAYFGKIVAIEEKPHQSLITGNDGSLKYADTPDRFDLTLTVHFHGTKNEKGFFTEGNVHIAHGEELAAKTLYVKTTAIVESLSETIE